MRIGQTAWASALQAAWWDPSQTLPWAALLHRLAVVYRWLWQRSQSRPEPAALSVPVLVVGNIVVGGAGKTPTVMALARALGACGWRVGVISKGYGSRASHRDRPQAVGPQASAEDVGDEPLLIARTLPEVPVWVGRDRQAVARALLQAHPAVTLLLSDDGLQHRDLPRQVQVLVFDERGVGNGQLLPAGPLRQPLPSSLPPNTWVVYNAAAPSTPLPGVLAERQLAAPQAWSGSRGDVASTWAAWQGREVVGVAGIGHPERFFGMLRAQGLQVHRCPLPDHATLQVQADLAPWEASGLPVLMTAKDAVKLKASDLQHSPWRPRLWVVGLDFSLPDSFVQALHRALISARDTLALPTRPHEP